jgi:hypothetical protein
MCDGCNSALCAYAIGHISSSSNSSRLSQCASINRLLQLHCSTVDSTLSTLH